jgi:sugar/nucleoside kinase (ribokinase family)
LTDVELTLIANVALDRVDHGQWTSGGCPTFAPPAFRRLGARGTIITACAADDRPAFRSLAAGDELLAVRFVASATTSRFELTYHGEFGESRSMVVHTIGHAWSEADIDALEIESEWVHLAPLLRTDFPVATVARLAARGHRISYDGQGLVRVPRTGELTLDAGYDRGLLPHLTVLKLSEDEADVLARDAGRDAALAELAGVPELLLTLGFRGAEIRCAGTASHVPAHHVVADVQTTGAGDAFMIGYLIGRHRGLAPPDAATMGADVSAAMLSERAAR